MTIILVEGSDCSGKTTLIEKLFELTSYPIVKGSSFEQSTCTNEELFDKFLEMTELDNVIFDRFIYSNFVYASLYEDFSILSDTQRKQIEDKIKDKAVIIYLEADMDTLIDRMNTRGDDYVTVDKLESIKERYAESIGNVDNIKILRFNTTYMTTDEIVKKVLSE